MCTVQQPTSNHCGCPWAIPTHSYPTDPLPAYFLCAGLQLEVAATADPAGSLVRIALTAADPEAQTAAARLLAAALKGALPGAEGGGALGPLLVVHMEGALGLVAPLLRGVLYPRLVLYCAQLRQVSLH